MLKAVKGGKCLVELTSIDMYAVGIAVFESKGKLISHCDAAEISNVTSNSTFLVELNNLLVDLRPNEAYTIVVSTFKPQQQGYYDLKVSMDVPFKCEEIRNEQYNFKESFEGEWTEFNSKGCEKFITTAFQAFMRNPNFLI